MTKPRFDGKGSLFGELHRQLDSDICMLDIDRMSLLITQQVWLHKENECFIEYRHDAEQITFKAIFELKYKFNERIFDLNESVNRARIAIAKKLECKLFVVIGNQSPLEFYEIDTETGAYNKSYTLIFTNDKQEQKKAMEKCWQQLGLQKAS